MAEKERERTQSREERHNTFATKLLPAGRMGRISDGLCPNLITRQASRQAFLSSLPRFQRQREGYWRLGSANFARSKVREESTALRKKVLAKIGEGMSVRAHGQCIGCFKLVGRRKEGNSNMHDFFHGLVHTFNPFE